MNYRTHLRLFLLLLLSFVFSDYSFAQQVRLEVKTKSAILGRVAHIERDVLNQALTLYYCGKLNGQSTSDYLTIVDFSRPSYEKRLWVFNVQNNKLLLNTWVAHGINSGELYAEYFSNEPESNQSSLGLFKTGMRYLGSHVGYSLPLIGLSPGYNDNVEKRSVVVHGAWYVSEDYIKKYGRIGRSWGCPAVPENVTNDLINIINGGSLFVIYYPDKKWLNDLSNQKCPTG